MRVETFALAALLLGGCSQSDAPSDRVEEAAEEIVEAAQGIEPEPEEQVLGRYAPRDECGEMEGAAAFQEKLAAAIAARDADVLVSLAAEDIKLDFGGGEGADELRNLISAEGSGLWGELDKLLALGCAENSQGGITIPWYFAQEMGDDPFQTMIVMGEEIPLLSPEDGKAVEHVSWDAVLLSRNQQPGSPFEKVSYGEIEEAYVARAMLRSPIDYRLIASSRNGTWSITSLVAGD